MAHFDDDDLYASGYLTWMKQRLDKTLDKDGPDLNCLEKQPALHKESRTEWDFRRRHNFVLVVSYLIEGSSLWP